MNKIQFLIDAKGLVVLETKADGSFSANHIAAPSEWVKAESDNWLRGLMGNIKTCQFREPDTGFVKFHTIIETTTPAVTLTVFTGEEQAAVSARQALQQQWMQANGISLSIPEAPPAPAPEAAQQSKTARRVPLSVVVAASVLAVAGLGVGGFFAAQQFMQGSSNVPSMDMSNLSIDQIAEIDQNPQAMNTLRDGMMEAVRYGTQSAISSTEEISKQHFDILKSMGLEGGVSMENATACLSSLQ